MSVSKRKNGSWRYRVWVTLPSGTKKRLTGKPVTNTKKAAEHAERMAILEACDPAAANLRKERNKNEETTVVPSISGYIKTYLGVTSEDGKATARKAKARILNVDIGPVFGHLRLDEITQMHIDQERTKLLKGTKKAKGTKERKGIQLRTVNNVFSELGSLLRYAYTNKAGPDPSAMKFFWKADEVELEALSDDGFEGLLGACEDPRYRVALLLAHDAGCRIGEIRGMRWSDVEESAGKYGRLHIRRQIDTLNNVTSTKGKRKRVVPLLMNGELHSVLKELMPAERASWSGDGYLITRTKDGRGRKELGTEPLSYSTMREEVYRLYEVSGVTRPRLPWHSMRHSYCTKLANSGAPVHHVMKMAGHKSIETTLKYMHTDEDALQRTMEKAFGTTVGPEKRSKQKSPAN